ncbi:hypothetical protein DPMN_153409 [Dreissena polymorpha]|uniref:Uncharacterized protein n=1 Tax=Dreissena polymorpha TaxID=45954 RepID=A0A9D4FJ52_DREPO|nr:hypothetical protein DPMN_070318 [Dreissena polymorpha]KAH3799793.1 hypothetical protein DPMN_153409 [Dreissena polymorpha]
MYQSFRNGSVATVISKPGDCPAPCQDHKLCETCLGSKGSEGGSLECYWSVTLAEVSAV